MAEYVIIMPDDEMSFGWYADDEDNALEQYANAYMVNTTDFKAIPLAAYYLFTGQLPYDDSIDYDDGYVYDDPRD